MSFYDLSKTGRVQLMLEMHAGLLEDYRKGTTACILAHFNNADTYIRKTAYIATGRIYSSHEELKKNILEVLVHLLDNGSFYIRQTAINAAGEIGMKNFAPVESFMDKGLTDTHHAVRNAVIGSVKKMGQKNPVPVLAWASRYLHHPDKEIRREICHGIELRGRTHPQDILPMLKTLQFDKTARVANTLVHVLGQIAYKKNCIQTVVQELKTWENTGLVAKALEEIIDVHDRYRNFAVLTQDEAKKYIAQHF